MKIDLYQIDAFTEVVFKGNPAAVCPLEKWLSDETLQNIAEENNLSETAYFVPEGDGYRIRWFTPGGEVDLCGHATLATAYVIFTILKYKREEIHFKSKSGKLIVNQGKNQELIMNFPSQPPIICNPPDNLAKGLGKEPLEVLCHDDYLAVFNKEEDIRSLTPNFELLKKLDRRGIIVSAPGKKHDFVSRFFAPRYNINEDPVTGSAHCELTPYWSEKLGKTILHAKQVSQRGGNIICELKKDRVFLTGKAVQYMKGQIRI